MSDESKHLIEQAEMLLACDRCKGEGWLEPIGPKSDGSYITSRPCPKCDSRGTIRRWRQIDEPKATPVAKEVK